MTQAPSPLPTLPVSYKDCAYWIDGKPPQTSEGKGEYRYYIRRRPGAEPTVSSEVFDRIINANRAAREAIDRLAAIAEPPAPKSRKRRAVGGEP